MGKFVHDYNKFKASLETIEELKRTKPHSTSGAIFKLKNEDGELFSISDGMFIDDGLDLEYMGHYEKERR